jgi:hypothetical protein
MHDSKFCLFIIFAGMVSKSKGQVPKAGEAAAESFSAISVTIGM